jgi:hypothetical protein
MASRAADLTEAQMDRVRHRLLTDPQSPFRRAQAAKQEYLARATDPRDPTAYGVSRRNQD